MSNDEESRYAQGLAIRRAVLGSEHVDRSLNSSTPFGAPLQELITEYCWGAVWSRAGLDRRTRSLVNVALLAAMNRQDELRLHVAGALRNSCSEEEIRETLLQTAVYCGIPAAVEAFRTAETSLLAAHAEMNNVAHES